ncbi:uncharacterized protein M6D78_016001 [Vipera latastei]
MPSPEPRSAWRRSGGGCCGGCGGCQKREVKALRCLCALSLVGLLVLALPVVYLMRARLAEKDAAEEEMLIEKMFAPQKQYGSPPCNSCDSKIRPSIHARVRLRRQHLLREEDERHKKGVADDYPQNLSVSQTERVVHIHQSHQ